MTFSRMPVVCEVKNDYENPIFVATELGAHGIWYDGYQETRLDPGEAEGYEVDSIRLASTPELHSHMLPCACISVHLDGNEFVCELSPNYREGDVIHLDSDRLMKAAAQWMNDHA